jgi:hypothetical protein
MRELTQAVLYQSHNRTDQKEMVRIIVRAAEAPVRNAAARKVRVITVDQNVIVIITIGILSTDVCP